MSPRNRAMLRVIEYIAKSLKQCSICRVLGLTPPLVVDDPLTMVIDLVCGSALVINR